MTPTRRSSRPSRCRRARGRVRLRPVAYLLCRDWHRADDLVQTSAVKLYVHWERAAQIGNLDGCLRTILVNTYIEEQRSTWWKRITLHHEHHDRARRRTRPVGRRQVRRRHDHA